MARGAYKQKIMGMAGNCGWHVVKKPMDDGFMLAIYAKGKTIYRRIMRLPSEVAYEKLWMDAYYTLASPLHGSYPEYADPKRWPEYVYGRNGVRSDGSIIDWEGIYTKK